MHSKHYYQTIVLSDIHLGTTHSKVNQLCEFLDSTVCKRLILNGDIIDGWSLQKGMRRWKPQHTQFFKQIMQMSEKNGTEIIYVQGNHDDFLNQFTPLNIGGIKIVKDYILESNGRHYFVTHGDIFDKVTTEMKWLSHLGDIAYTLLLWANHYYNRYRSMRGKSYFSLSQAAKHKVKTAVSYISDFETTLVEHARTHQCDGIICGHIHHPENRMLNGVHYLNSGDWVETLSALTEDENGHWNVVYPAQETVASPVSTSLDYPLIPAVS